MEPEKAPDANKGGSFSAFTSARTRGMGTDAIVTRDIGFLSTVTLAMTLMNVYRRKKMRGIGKNTHLHRHYCHCLRILRRRRHTVCVHANKFAPMNREVSDVVVSMVTRWI